MKFHLEKDCGPRAGLLVLPQGEVPTPAFMPVGTRAAIKAATPQQVRETGTGILLANTYHLALRPGVDTIESLGGLHRFMGWPGSILTDSGGFQVFSLAALNRVSDEGVAFQSHYDGSSVFFSPRDVVALQGRLGSDLIMPLDQCVPYPASEALAREAMDRTVRWARESLEEKERWPGTLFAIVQGGVFRPLREACAKELAALDFPGYAVGGVSVGEERAVLEDVLSYTLPLLPADRPRYVMGVGPPATLLSAIALGADMFDCVLPTRNARSGYAFTRTGTLRLKNAAHTRSTDPVDSRCGCLACTRFSRGYIRHLLNVDEILGSTLVTLHNLTYFQDLMSGARAAILEDRFDAFQAEVEAAYGGAAGSGQKGGREKGAGGRGGAERSRHDRS